MELLSDGDDVGPAPRLVATRYPFRRDPTVVDEAAVEGAPWPSDSEAAATDRREECGFPLDLRLATVGRLQDDVACNPRPAVTSLERSRRGGRTESLENGARRRVQRSTDSMAPAPTIASPS